MDEVKARVCRWAYVAFTIVLLAGTVVMAGVLLRYGFHDPRGHLSLAPLAAGLGMLAGAGYAGYQETLRAASWLADRDAERRIDEEVAEFASWLRTLKPADLAGPNA